MTVQQLATMADPEADRLRREGATFIAGGTDLLQLMQEQVASPTALLDLSPLGLTGVAEDLSGLRIGALSRLADVAEDPLVRDRLPVVRQALLETASHQVRNMATVGGNLLQRTRCLYFRDAATPCNKRVPGSGCPAQDGRNRMNAIFGGSPHCIAVQPSDLAVALVALDAEVILDADGSERSLAVAALHRLPEDRPDIETALQPGEIITSVWVPAPAPDTHMAYVKVRDRASFEWALTSCAAVIRLEADRVAEARIAVGGVATKPWRLPALEEALRGRRLDSDTIAAVSARAAEGAQPRGDNAFKVELLQRTVAQALIEIGEQP